MMSVRADVGRFKYIGKMIFQKVCFFLRSGSKRGICEEGEWQFCAIEAIWFFSKEIRLKGTENVDVMYIGGFYALFMFFFLFFKLHLFFLSQILSPSPVFSLFSSFFLSFLLIYNTVGGYLSV